MHGNAREIAVIISDYQKSALSNSQKQLTDPTLVYYLSTNNFQSATKLATNWMRSRSADRISLFNREGRFLASVFYGPNGEVQNEPNLESRDIALSDTFLKQAAGQDQLLIAETNSKKALDLVVFTRVKDRKGEIAGYMEQVTVLSQSILDNLHKRMNLEIAVLDSNGELISSTHPDLLLLPKDIFKTKINAPEESFNLSLREVPYGFLIKPVNWGQQKFYVALGASKSTSNAILRTISIALIVVGLVVIFLLVLTSIVSSRLILRPLSNLVDATLLMDQGDQAVEIPVEGNNEIGVLTESFNEMSRRIAQARNELRAKIRELEIAYSELKDTQARLVHSAKMASLGQLVAGVAHELNNPIGFIYANMSHLREYSQKLIRLIEIAEKEPEKLDKLKEDLEYSYILDDMPKLIKSCEEGAKRTRDIVLGLRNFSRLEEAKIKKVDLREGIEDTLALLSGDTKNRIKVITNFKPAPPVLCYASQLNQVFMNILTNAVQAIPGEGEIHISLEPQGKSHVHLSIRDTGKGMSADIVDKIFDPFFTTKTVGQGTGLGLSISYGIIKNHQGEIQVKSEPGKGTEFIITLPIDGPA